MKSSVKFGLPPGTVIYTGERSDLETKYELAHYNEQGFKLDTNPSNEEIWTESDINKWLLIKGFKNVASIQYTVSAFDLPPMILEDILNVNQRPHILTKDDKICFILTYYNLEFNRKQLSIWLTPKEVITFQETHDEMFEPLFNRLSSEQSETRRKGPDRLACVILDYVVDMYYIMTDKLDEEISELENNIVNSDDPASHLKEIYQMKNKVQAILQDTKAMRELVNSLVDDFSNLITADSIAYIKDVDIHLTQILDMLERFKATLSSIVDLSSAISSNRMNEIMKFLTILSAFFLPGSFLCGWYGMNWEMPEQKNHLIGGYIIFIVVNIFIIIGIYLWFKKKKWL
jgi:magnesium transporter